MAATSKEIQPISALQEARQTIKYAIQKQVRNLSDTKVSRIALIVVEESTLAQGIEECLYTSR